MAMGFDPEDDALNRILNDMDGMESNKMFGDQDASKGVSITISVVPNGGEGDKESDEYPEGHDESLCGGGCAYHKGGSIDKDFGAESLPGDKMMATGGIVDGVSINKDRVNTIGESGESAEEDAKKLPPFLRKKKKPLQDA